MKKQAVNGSVKVMLSYDYCHFEIALSSDQLMTLSQLNALRKDAMRLADEAVRQYKVAKEKAQNRSYLDHDRKRLTAEVEQIHKLPKKEWSAEQKAKVKALKDHIHWSQHDYDYEDDERDL